MNCEDYINNLFNSKINIKAKFHVPVELSLSSEPVEAKRRTEIIEQTIQNEV